MSYALSAMGAGSVGTDCSSHLDCGCDHLCDLDPSSSTHGTCQEEFGCPAQGSNDGLFRCTNPCDPRYIPQAPGGRGKASPASPPGTAESSEAGMSTASWFVVALGIFGLGAYALGAFGGSR